MSVVTKRSVLTGIKAREAMRRQVVSIRADASLDACIRDTIKYKVNAVLATGEGEKPAGVVSKTDLMGAYYAGLPLDSPAESIMVGPPLSCRPDIPLEQAIEQMRSHRVHRLYVSENEGESVLGVLAYPDIVGLLYRYCAKCKRNTSPKKTGGDENSSEDRILAREVMTPGVKSHGANESLFEAMEGLAEYRFGAVLIRDGGNKPVGVLSKTDLILAYRHGISAESPVESIMNSPVKTCLSTDFLSQVVRRMILSDVHRLFVREDGDEDGRIVGVISLTDAAKVRSGSCKACTASRFLE